MKRIFTFGLFFLTGGLVGGVVSAFVVANHWERQYASLYAVGVQSQAMVAGRIHRGEAEQLKAHCIASLPDGVLAVANSFPETPSTATTFHVVRDVYRLLGVPAPEKISSLLSSVPEHSPGTGCQVLPEKKEASSN